MWKMWLKILVEFGFIEFVFGLLGDCSYVFICNFYFVIKKYFDVKKGGV